MPPTDAPPQPPRAGCGPSNHPARWALGVTLLKPLAMVVGLVLHAPAAPMEVIFPALPFLALAYPFSALLAWPLSRVLGADLAWELGEIVSVFLVALLVFRAYRGVKRVVTRALAR